MKSNDEPAEKKLKRTFPTKEMVKREQLVGARVLFQERLATTIYLCKACSQNVRNTKVTTENDGFYSYTMKLCYNCVTANREITLLFNSKVLANRFGNKV